MIPNGIAQVVVTHMYIWDKVSNIRAGPDLDSLPLNPGPAHLVMGLDKKFNPAKTRKPLAQAMPTAGCVVTGSGRSNPWTLHEPPYNIIVTTIEFFFFFKLKWISKRKRDSQIFKSLSKKWKINKEERISIALFHVGRVRKRERERDRHAQGFQIPPKTKS